MTNSRASSFKQTSVIKLVDETVNSSTTPQADDELLLPVKASKTYTVRLLLFVNSNATPDFKHGFTAPSGATMLRTNAVYADPVPSSTTDALVANGAVTDGNNQSLVLFARLIVSTTAGTLTFVWSQNTSDAGDTKVLAGSSLTILES